MNLILFGLNIVLGILEKEIKDYDLKEEESGWKQTLSGKELGYDFICCREWLKEKSYDNNFSIKIRAKLSKTLERIQKDIDYIYN